MSENANFMIYVSLRELLIGQLMYITGPRYNNCKYDELIMLSQHVCVLSDAINAISNCNTDINGYYGNMVKYLINNDANEGIKDINDKLIDKMTYLLWQRSQTYVELPKNKPKLISNQWDILTAKIFSDKYCNGNVDSEQILFSKCIKNGFVGEANIDGINTEVIKTKHFKLNLISSKIFELEFNYYNNINAYDLLFNKKMNLLDRIVNKISFRIVCCILFEPRFCIKVLELFLSDTGFDINGYNTELKHEIKLKKILDPIWLKNFMQANKIDLTNNYIFNLKNECQGVDQKLLHYNIFKCINYIENIMDRCVSQNIDLHWKQYFKPNLLIKPLQNIIDLISKPKLVKYYYIETLFDSRYSVHTALKKLLVCL